MFNSLAVGGVIGLVGPGPVLDTTLGEVGAILMIGIVGVSWLMMISRRGVERWEGSVLIVLWLAAVIILSSGDEAAAAVLGTF
jgi:Ca2+/Na+ antiporter